MSNNEDFDALQTEIYSSLSAIETDCWQRITKGSIDFKSDFHQPATGTLCSAGANLRTVVLRQVWPSAKQLSFHTDVRSGKIADLKSNPAITWLFYSPTQRVQIRLSGIANIHTHTKLAQTAWDNTKLTSRKTYLSAMAPGAISAVPTDGISSNLANKYPNEEESEEGRKHFAVVVTDVHWMEWLWLNHKGHRRAGFRYRGGEYSSQWLIP